MQVWQVDRSTEKLDKLSDVSYPNSENNVENAFLAQSMTPQVYSSGYVKCSFDNSAGKNLPKVPNSFWEYQIGNAENLDNQKMTTEIWMNAEVQENHVWM